MGCNESKPAVATNNTISKRPFRKKSSIKTKDVDSNAENNPHVITKNPSPLQGVVEDKPSNEPSKDEVKDISVNTDTRDAQVVDEKNRVEETIVAVEPGKSISSPDHYFSSRKDEDATESIATEEEGYFSPNKDSVKDDELKEEVELKDEVNENVVPDEPVVENSSVVEEAASVDDGETKIKEDEKVVENNLHIITENPSPVHEVEVNKPNNDDVKNISPNIYPEDSQVDEQNKTEGGGAVVEPGNSISSPNLYLSPRKDEDAVESINISQIQNYIKDEEFIDNVELKDKSNENIFQDEQVEKSFIEEETTNEDDGETKITENKEGHSEKLSEENMTEEEEEEAKVSQTFEVFKESSRDTITDDSITT